MATKITSVTDDYILPLPPLALLIVACETAFPFVVSQARHFGLARL